MIVYNPNDEGVEITIILPANTGFGFDDLVKAIEGSLVYTADNDINIDSERIQEPIVKVKLI